MKANVADGAPENDGTGGWILSTDPLVLESWRLAFGGEALPTQESQTYIFDTPASVAAFTFLKTLIDENCAWTALNPAPYPYFAQRSLFYSGSLLDLSSPGARHQSQIGRSLDGVGKSDADRLAGLLTSGNITPFASTE